jgi:hypothetical protein
MDDLMQAVEWGAKLSPRGVLLTIRADRVTFPEVIEISGPGGLPGQPGWIIWRGSTDKIIVVSRDGGNHEFTKLGAALHLIGSQIDFELGDEDAFWHKPY